MTTTTTASTSTLLYMTDDPVHYILANIIPGKCTIINPYELTQLLIHRDGKREQVADDDDNNDDPSAAAAAPSAKNIILHISNPISDIMYKGIDSGGENIRIHDIRETKSTGNWKQTISSYVQDFEKLRDVENMLKSDNYMLKYIEHIKNTKYDRDDYNILIEDVTNLVLGYSR